MLKEIVILLIFTTFIIYLYEFASIIFGYKPIIGYAISLKIPSFIGILAFAIIFALFFGMVVFYGLFR